MIGKNISGPSHWAFLSWTGGRWPAAAGGGLARGSRRNGTFNFIFFLVQLFERSMILSSPIQVYIYVILILDKSIDIIIFGPDLLMFYHSS